MMDYDLSQIPFFYTLWFIFLFLIPVLIILRYNRIDPELLDLKGLMLTPILTNDNIVAISSNYEDFLKKHPNLSKSNVIVKIFKNVCGNAKKGISYNPNLYILSHRATLRKITLWMLLGSHIPFLILLLAYKLPLAEILKYQVCCYLLVYVLEMIFQHKHTQFSKMFYTNWYNRILNFDLLTVKLIRSDVENINKLSNSRDLLEVVNKFEETNAVFTKNISEQSGMLSARLDELINIQQRTNGINAQSIILSLDDSIAKYREMNTNIQSISESIKDSFESITNLSKKRKDEINAINKNTELLLDIRERFKNYQSEAFKTELAQLQAITNSLDSNVNKAFASAGNVLTQNFERLEKGYDDFFDMCRSLSGAISENYEEKTAAALSLLFNGLESEFLEIRKQTEKTSETIEKTTQATELLCRTVYDFTQHTLNPGFMKKISEFVNFSNSLKSVKEKLVSYEKIASLFKVNNTDESGKGDKNTE